MRSLNMRRPHPVGALCAFLALFLASYYAVLTETYGIDDDYDALLYAGSTPISDSYQIWEGRPLDAVWTHFAFSLATEIEHLRYIRFVGILGIALLAWSVYLILAHAGHRKFQAFCLSAVMGLSLPVQIYVAWAMTADFVFSMHLSVLAFLLSNRAFERRRRAQKWSLAAGAVLLLLAAITIYQPSGMFFWVVAAVVLAEADRPLRDAFRRFGWCLMIVCAGMLLALAALLLGERYVPIDSPRNDIATDFAGKAEFFLLQVFPNALNFAWFPVDAIFTWAIFIIMFIGLLMHFQGALRERLWKYVIAASILVLSVAPSLLSRMNLADYRVLPALTAIVILHAYFALLGYQRRLRLRSPVGLNFIMGLTTIACALSAAHNVRTYLVIPHVQELKSMRSQLRNRVTPASEQGISSPIMISPVQSASCTPVGKHEFGSSSSTWIPSLRSMAFLSLRDVFPELRHAQLTIDIESMKSLGCAFPIEW